MKGLSGFWRQCDRCGNKRSQNIHSVNLTSCVDGFIRIFDIRKGEITKDYYQEPIVCLDVGQNDSTLIASFLNSEIKLIDTNISNSFLKNKT